MRMFTCLILSFVLVYFKNALAEQCPPRLNCALRLTCGAKASIQSLHNIEKKMGVVIDTDNDLSLLFDSNLGTQILYDHKRSRGVRTTNAKGADSDVQSNVTQYVESISSLRELSIYKAFKQKINTFKIRTASDEIVSAHRNIVQTLEPEMSDFAEYKKTDILSISVNLFKELCKIRKKKLRKIFDMKLGLKNSLVYGGLINVVSVFRGLSSMLEETQGRVESLILKPDFNIQPMFMAECGSESLALFLDQIEKREVELLQNLRYPSILYKIVREFDGGLYKGLRGIETLIYHLIQFSQNKVSLEVLVDILIQVTASIEEANYSMIKKKVKSIEKIVSAKASPTLSKIISHYANAFLEDNLVINNININDIVKNHLVGRSFGLPNVVSILHKMNTNFYGCLDVLLKRMSFFVMTGQAPFYVLRLMPSLKNSLDLKIGVSPLVQIGESLRPEIFQEFSEQTFESTIRSIPVIGSLFEGISRTLPIVDEDQKSWISEITKFDSYQSIFGWLKFGMGIEGGIEPDGCVHEMGLWGLDRVGCTCWD